MLLRRCARVFQRYRVAAALAAVLIAGCAYLTDGLYPFYDRECTSFPDGPWTEQCCIPHDEAYLNGGTEKQRQIADFELGICMVEYFPPDVVDSVVSTVRSLGEPWWGRE